jgi:hypothetical protein
MAYPFAPRRQENKTGVMHHDENDAESIKGRKKQTGSSKKSPPKQPAQKPVTRLSIQK